LNYSSEILKFLSSKDTGGALLVAPNAPPVTRTCDGIQVAMNAVLDADDVMDTLAAFVAQAQQGSPASIPDSGSFSYGIKGVGRVRVSYMTQRGTKVLAVIRIPCRIPDLQEVCDNLSFQDSLLSTIGRRGIIAVSGPSSVSNSLFVYALLNHLNKSVRKLIFILERHLTFLVSHGECIVIQTELTDHARSFEAGLQGGLILEPDIVYVGDIRAGDEIPSLAHAVRAGVCTIVSSVGLGNGTLSEQCACTAASPGDDPPAPCLLVKVLPAAGGKISVQVSEKSHAG
jgi:twitching motility protein PilT